MSKYRKLKTKTEHGKYTVLYYNDKISDNVSISRCLVKRDFGIDTDEHKFGFTLAVDVYKHDQVF